MTIVKIEALQIDWGSPDVFPPRSAWLLVHDDSGLVGLGEASPMLDGDLSLQLLQSKIAPRVIGRDPLEAGVLQHELMFDLMKLGPHGIVAAALAALDIALWDIKGKILNLPIYTLLGGAFRKQLPFYASVGHLGRYSVKDVQRMVEARLPQQPALIKLRMEHKRGTRDVDVEGDLAKASAVRQLVGDDLPLAFDASNGYSRTVALRVGRQLEDLGYSWFEEPVEHFDLASMSVLSAKLDIPIAAGEQAYLVSDVLGLIAAGVSIVQPDLIKMGGFTGLLECRAVAAAHGVDLVPHQTQPTIGNVANLHFAAALPHLSFPCEVNDSTARQHAVFDNPPAPTNGRYELSDAPGLGLRVRMAQVEKLTIGRAA